MHRFVNMLKRLHRDQKGGIGQGTVIMLIGSAVAAVIFGSMAFNIGQPKTLKDYVNSAQYQQVKDTTGVSASDNVTYEVENVIDNITKSADSSLDYSAPYNNSIPSPQSGPHPSHGH